MAVPRRPFMVFAIFGYILGLSCGGAAGAQYLGKFLGKLTELHHGVSGEVYAVDARTLHIKDFTYDGQGPAAYFFAGSSRAPGNTGFRIRDENGSPDVLRRYRKEGVTITLPEGKSLNNIKWFSVWCEEFEVNFGDVKIPKNFDYPRPQKIDGLRGVHAVSSENIVIVDAQTLLVPSLSYDGEAPDAKFWVGRGSKPSPQGIRVPDENGKEVPLRRYDRKTVVLTLPGDLTVFDIGHFGIWCEAFTVDFGHVQIPQNLNVPPSLKMLGVSPQKRPRDYQSDTSSSSLGRQSQSQAQHTLVGGRVEATTYRPQASSAVAAAAILAHRRSDQLNFNPNVPHAANRQQNFNQGRHEVVNRDIYSRNHAQNAINPYHFQPQPFYQHQQQHQPQQHFYINPQQQQQQHHLLVHQQQFHNSQLLTQPQTLQQEQIYYQLQRQQPQPQQQHLFKQNLFQNQANQLNHFRQPVGYTPFNQIPQQSIQSNQYVTYNRQDGGFQTSAAYLNSDYRQLG